MELRSTYEAEAPIQLHIKSMEMLPELSALLMFFVFIVFAIVTCGIALLRVPTSIAMYLAFLLALLASRSLIQWWRRNSGSIAFTASELIVTPRSGPTLKRYFSETARIERYSEKVQHPFTAPMIENYVHIVSDNEIPLQFLWETRPLTKRKNQADLLVQNLQMRVPTVEVLTKPEPLEDIKVDHARRGALKRYSVSVRLFAVLACGFGGLFLNILVPRSHGPATQALQPIEQSLSSVRRTPLPVENSSEAYSVSCYGENGRDSYWEEDFFNLEIRYFSLDIAVHSDKATAVARSRKVLPKGWVFYAWDAAPDPSGDTHLNVKSPCFTAKTASSTRLSMRGSKP
jgi:hypothetical protein